MSDDNDNKTENIKKTIAEILGKRIVEDVHNVSWHPGEDIPVNRANRLSGRNTHIGRLGGGFGKIGRCN